MNTAEKFQILILSDHGVTDFMKSTLEERSARIEVLTCPDHLIPGNWTGPTQVEVTRLADHVEKTDADLAVIGNNMGTGIKISRVLSAKSRVKVVIFYHLQPNPEHQRQYESLGITRYQTKVPELEEMVAGLLRT